MALVECVHMHGFYHLPAVLLLSTMEGVTRLDHLFYARWHLAVHIILHVQWLSRHLLASHLVPSTHFDGLALLSKRSIGRSQSHVLPRERTELKVYILLKNEKESRKEHQKMKEKRETEDNKNGSRSRNLNKACLNSIRSRWWWVGCVQTDVK